MRSRSPKARGRRRWPRRLLALVALLVAAGASLHLGPVRQRVRATLERLATRATGARVVLGALGYQLWRGQAELLRLSLDWPHLQVAADRVEVRLATTTSVDLDVEGLRIRVGGEPPAHAPDPAESRPFQWPRLHWLASARVRDASLVVAAGPGEPRLVLDRVELEAQWREAAHHVVLSVGDGAIVLLEQQHPIEPLAVEADVVVGAHGLRVRDLRLAAAASRVSARGTLDRPSPPTGTLEAEVELDAAEVGGGLGVPARGRLDGRVSLRASVGALEGEADLEARALEIQGVGPTAGRVHAVLGDGGLDVSARDLGAWRGRVDLEGRLDEAGGRVELRARDVDAATLLEDTAGQALPLAASTAAEVRLGLPGAGLDGAAGTARLLLQPRATAGLPLEGEVELRLDGRTLVIRSDGLRAHAARAAFEARLAPGSGFSGRFRLESGELAQVAALLHSAGLPAPPFDVAGALVFDGGFSDGAFEARVSGELAAPFGPRFEVAGDVELDGSEVRLRGLELRSGEGRARVDAALPFGEGSLTLEADLDALAPGPEDADEGALAGVRVDGRVFARGPMDDVEWGGTVRAVLPHGGGEEGDPGSLNATFTGHGDRLEVESLTLALAGGHLEGRGRLAWSDRALDLRASGTGFRLAELGIPGLSPERLDGRLSVEADVRGSPQALGGTLQLGLDGGTFLGQPLQPLVARAEGRGASVDLALRSAGSPLVDGGLGWPSRDLVATLDLGALPTSALLRSAGVGEGVDLAMAGEAEITVPALDLAALRLVARANSAVLSSRRLDVVAAPFRLEGDRSEIRVLGLALRGPGVRLALDGRLGLAAPEPLDLKVEGELQLAALGELLGVAEADGQISADMSLAGAVGSPRLTGELRVVGARGRRGAAALESLDLSVRGAGDRLALDRLEASLLGGRLEAHGTLPLASLAAGALELSVRGLDLSRLVAPASPGRFALVDVGGRLELAGPTLGGVSGAGTLERLDLADGSSQAGLAAPVAWRLAGGRLDHEPLRLRGEGTDLGLSLGVSGEGFQLEARGVAESGLGRWLLAESLPQPSGPLELELTAATGTGGLSVDGRAALNGRLVLPDAAMTLSPAHAELRFSGTTVELVAFEGQVGDGRVRGDGVLSTEDLAAARTSLRFDAERMPLTAIDGVRGRVSGEVHVAGDGEQLRVSGAVTAAGVRVTRELDTGTRSLDALEQQLAQLDEETTLAERIRLDVQLRTRDDARVVNSMLDVEVGGALRVTGSLAAPDLSGSVSVRPSGRVRVGRAVVRVVSGEVDLSDYPADPLRVDLVGRARVGGVALELQAEGSLDDLQVQLTAPERSDLTQGDLATLLMTGRTARAAASESGAILAEELAATLGGAIQQRMGGDLYVDVSSDQLFAFDDADPASRFSVGRRLGPDFSVAYSTALDGTDRRWLVTYEPDRGRIRARLIAEEDGSVSGDVTHRTALGTAPRTERRDEPPEIGSVDLAGAGPPVDAELRETIRSRPGSRFEYWRADEDAERLRRRLHERGFPGALVDVVSRERDDGRIELVFQIETGPGVELCWRGDDVGGQRRERLEGLWPPGLPVDQAAAGLARETVFDLQSDGYPLARAVPEVERSAAGWRACVDVLRGPRAKAVRLELPGREQLSEAALLAGLPDPGSRAFYEALADGGARLRAALRSRYAAEGFLAARIGEPVPTWDAGPARLSVRVPVEEGPRSLLDGLEVPPELASGDGAEAPELKLRIGQPFRLEDYLADRATLTALLRRRGYADARVVGRLEPLEGGVGVRFESDPGPLVRVGEIRVGEGARTRESAVRRALLLAEGDAITPEALSGSRRRLTESRVLRSAELRPVASGQPGVRDLEVQLVERPPLELEYGVRYTTTGSGEVGSAPSSRIGGQTQLSTHLEWSNPFGQLHRYQLFSYLAFDRQLFGGGFEAPYSFGGDLLSQVFLYQDQADEDEIAELQSSRVRGVSLQQTRRWRDETDLRRWNDVLRLQWGYRFERYHFDLTPGIGERGEVDANRGSISVSLVGDTRDSFTNPHRGLFWSVTPSLTDQVLGSDVDFVLFYGQLFAFVPLGQRVVWASGYRLGVIPGDDPTLLIQDRFRAGGAGTVRGVDQDSLGPRLPSGTTLGGQAIAVFNQELRFPIWKSLHGGVYWDAGQVFATASEFDLGELRHSVGAGLRLVLPFGPIRIDWARLLDAEPGESRSRFWFTLGHAF